MKIIKNLTMFIIVIALSMLVNSSFGQSTCSGTMNYSSISATAPYTRIGNGTSGSVRICLTANSLTGKCAGTNSSIVIYACGDATCSTTGGILAIWDETTPVGTCLTVYAGTYPCNGYIRARRYCGGGSASISWTTMNGLTNSCTSTLVTANTNGTDCSTPTMLCNSGTFAGNASGAGYQELGCGSSATNRGCLLNGENNSAWYRFKALTNGTITLSIAPSANRDDYDFAIWSGWNCPPNIAPTRCSYELGTGTTGMNATATDNTEGASGDGWVNDLTVVAGETYTLLVDGFATAIDPNYDLTFGGTASLDCGILPVTFINVKGKYVDENVVKLNFSTIEERNNKKFEVEKSYNGKDFIVIHEMNTVGNSNFKIDYEYIDKNADGVNYYRIKQIDTNEMFGYSDIIHVSEYTKNKLSYKVYNLEYKEIHDLESYSGIYIKVYEDGNIEKNVKIN